MPRDTPPAQGKHALLALGVAQGQSLAAAARAAGTAESTARRWAADPAFKAKVDGLRRDMINRAVAVLTAGATQAAAVLLGLLKSESEETRLRAARAVLSDLMSVSQHADLSERLSALEAKLAERGTYRVSKSG